jgi:hypothetical protein
MYKLKNPQLMRHYLLAQRLAAQALGHFRLVVIIVTINPKPQLNVRSLSLGQITCSNVLGILKV